MTEKFRKDLGLILQRHITLGVESIFSAVYSGPSINTLSFNHILNRLMMLVQLPMTFVVLQRNGTEYSECFRTNYHKRHKGEIDGAISIAGENNYFPMWQDQTKDDRFYLLVLKADKSYEFAPLEIKKEICDAMTSWAIGSYKIHSALDSSNYTQYPGFVERIIGVIKNIESNVEKAEAEAKANSSVDIQPRQEMSAGLKKSFDLRLLSNLGSENYKDLRKRGVLDRVFKKIAKNISDVNADEQKNHDSLTNFMMFARDYHNAPTGTGRHESYNYSLRILLCDSQCDQVRNFFARLRASERDKRKRYANEISKINTIDKELAIGVDDAFWKMLKSGKKGEDKLLKIFGGYFGKTARSMADPVFDGLSFYRQPFAKDGGMARCFPNKNSKPEKFDDLPIKSAIRDDLLRVVLCQYLFDDMAATDDSAGLQLQIMLNPVEVGGRVWGVVAYATRSHDPDIPLETPQQLTTYDKYWSKNYHIYRDVNERMKRNLRSSMNSFYEGFVGKVFGDWIRDVVRRSGTGDGRNLSQEQDALNRQLCAIASVFPYDVVKVELERVAHDRPVPSSTQTKWECRAMAGRRWAAFVKVVGQARFPVPPGSSSEATRGFVDATDVAVAMTDRLLRGAFESPNQQGEDEKK